MRQYLYDVVTGKRVGVAEALLMGVLGALSLFYGACVIVLRCIKRMHRRRLPCVVVSVGNVTVGGTGKTSLVEYIARVLTQHGHKVGVVSRGYKKKTQDTKTPACRQAGKTQAEQMGDEPYMLQGNLPSVKVVVGADRAQAAQKAIAEGGVDTVILDDGLQQWGLRKDLEIVTIDATNPFSNGRLLPAGLLRQPLWTLATADVFVITKTNLASGVAILRSRLSSMFPQALIVEARHEPVGLYCLGHEEKPLALSSLASRPIAALSGIADPASFEALLTKLGASIAASFRYPDHHAFSARDMEAVSRQCREQPISAIVTTQKDACRLAPRLLDFCAAPGLTGLASARLCAVEILVLRIGVSITSHEKEFTERLLRSYRP